ncbi:hypothetical protein LFL96_08040 [Paraburkholderia sp. D15]|uniref:hypothetical protein n=1 Tax=Paraburkholderia sp. D15 TaxID=2880218 RepID=UPI0024789621|nr:hypothetical protein [Paraburkholderia sp. D15]WGS51437.1 hypothetical protein LFL96_08040 [Paraburkholderia sp. D15]
MKADSAAVDPTGRYALRQAAWAFRDVPLHDVHGRRSKLAEVVFTACGSSRCNVREVSALNARFDARATIFAGRVDDALELVALSDETVSLDDLRCRPRRAALLSWGRSRASRALGGIASRECTQRGVVRVVKFRQHDVLTNRHTGFGGQCVERIGFVHRIRFARDGFAAMSNIDANAWDDCATLSLI